MEPLLIPTEYTRYAHLTSLFILRASIYMFLYREFEVCILLFLTYIATNLHWHNLRPRSLVKNIDMMIVSITLLYSIYAANFYDCNIRYYICSSISVGGFCINEYWNWQTLYKPDFHLCSQREKRIVYTRTCAVHMFCLHLFQMENAVTVVSLCSKVT
jgi:hypothetical protein